jgi:hypothetical protein
MQKGVIMNRIKIIFASALMVISGTMMQAMLQQETSKTEQPKIKLPTAEVLHAYLAEIKGIEHYVQNTKIAEKLGDKEMAPLAVAVKVGTSLLTYSVAMQERKPEIIRALLRNFPEAIALIEKESALVMHTK